MLNVNIPCFVQTLLHKLHHRRFVTPLHVLASVCKSGQWQQRLSLRFRTGGDIISITAASIRSTSDELDIITCLAYNPVVIKLYITVGQEYDQVVTKSS